MSALRSILSRTPEEVFSDLATLFMYVVGVGAALVVFSLFVGIGIVIVKAAAKHRDGGDDD